MIALEINAMGHEKSRLACTGVQQIDIGLIRCEDEAGRSVETHQPPQRVPLHRLRRLRPHALRHKIEYAIQASGKVFMQIGMPRRD